MAEHNEEAESVVESLIEKIHAAADSSSSSSDEGDERKAKEKEKSVSAAVKEMQSKVFRIFGREKPVHSVLGGGRPADLMLWRNKKISASVLGAATAVWLLFEVLEYHLLTLISHCFIFSLAGLFVWSRICVFLHRAPPRIPELKLPEDLTVNVARSLRYEVNRGFAVLREIGSGKDLKKFLVIIAGLWFLSVLGSSCNFLTLCYIVFVLLYTVPVLYEKHEDKVDQFAEKASIEGQKYFAIFNEKCLSKIPRGPLKYKKLN